MKRTFTAKEKAFVFDLWKRGTGFSEIARILDSKPGTIFTMLRDTGGIKLSERRRAVAHLTLSEREEIRAGLSAKMSIRAIARSLNHSPSTILGKFNAIVADTATKLLMPIIAQIEWPRDPRNAFWSGTRNCEIWCWKSSS